MKQSLEDRVNLKDFNPAHCPIYRARVEQKKEESKNSYQLTMTIRFMLDNTWCQIFCFSFIRNLLVQIICVMKNLLLYCILSGFHDRPKSCSPNHSNRTTSLQQQQDWCNWLNIVLGVRNGRVKIKPYAENAISSMIVEVRSTTSTFQTLFSIKLSSSQLYKLSNHCETTKSTYNLYHNERNAQEIMYSFECSKKIERKT